MPFNRQSGHIFRVKKKAQKWGYNVAHFIIIITGFGPRAANRIRFFALFEVPIFLTQQNAMKPMMRYAFG